MILIQGKAVSMGVCRGHLAFYRRRETVVLHESGAGFEKESARFRAAQEKTARQLEAFAEKSRREMGEDAAALFETHAMLIEDEDYVACIYEKLAQENCSAEYAVQQAGARFSTFLKEMEDAYMCARAADIQDVTQRILDHLLGVQENGAVWKEPVILAADDLAPSETIRLDKSKILGFLLREGSVSGHTAILARAMGIPAVCGIGKSLLQEYEGREAYMDGETGQVVLAPDAPTLRQWENKLVKQEYKKSRMERVRGKEDVTLDGRQVHIYCNISSAEDVASVLANDGQGIGLFRTEFLYLTAQALPSEVAQFDVYRSVVSAMKGRKVIIRTMDIGADKKAAYLGLEKEENPALGYRAVRISLCRPELFRTQLRAIYRASAYGSVSIMFPMITSVWELNECRRMCDCVMQELRAEGIPFDPAVQIGVMIETPAAVLIADELAERADFFSVGTNDLTQYLLACDRQTAELGKFYDPHHPAVIRALKLTAEAAHRHGIWIGVCGELAADPSMLPTFLALRMDELSVSPPYVLPLRDALRKSIAEKTDTLL